MNTKRQRIACETRTHIQTAAAADLTEHRGAPCSNRLLRHGLVGGGEGRDTAAAAGNHTSLRNNRPVFHSSLVVILVVV